MLTRLPLRQLRALGFPAFHWSLACQPAALFFYDAQRCTPRFDPRRRTDVKLNGLESGQDEVGQRGGNAITYHGRVIGRSLLQR
jgi:hypothetical protein